MDDTTRLPDGLELEHDDAAGVYRAQYDWDADEALSIVVVAAVGTITKTNALDLPQLRESVDPDALDDIFAPTSTGHPRRAGSVEFPFAEHRIAVSATGEIEIRPPE
ncbi:HalOD1 output domain-containing protein [Halorussus amylolyticus]|uniref:HalOD1 output domain-containing protein n=1 Tax=Halorussus amylolyticus TaxID=1126242 RepID=UPI001048828B|nr:HalOD1 output domain-containing protein [Halorussus amylolyticus]